MKKIAFILMITFTTGFNLQAKNVVEPKFTTENVVQKEVYDCVREALAYAHGNYDLYLAYVRGCISGIK